MKLPPACILQKFRSWCSMANRYSPRRAMLYVPGDDLRKLNKARSLDVDCVVMDCEDGVAINRKKAARDNIRSLLDEGCILQLPSEWCVRVNSIESGLCEDDLSVVLGGDKTPPTLLLPKVQSKDHVVWFSDKLSAILEERSRRINVVMYIESARAVLDLVDICRKAEELSQVALFNPVALVLGSDDLCASLGVTRTADGTELLYARQKLVLVAKAFNLQAIDMVHIQYQDLEGLKKQCEAGAGMGYTGKQVIHPAQVPVVQKAFLPSPASVEWARGVVDAFQRHQAEGKVDRRAERLGLLLARVRDLRFISVTNCLFLSFGIHPVHNIPGKGAFTYQGSMIDMPSVLQAKRILQVASSMKR